jgi:glycosyltransferase involved in cell wall biosynthesis
MPYPPRGGATLRNYNLIKECAKTHKIHLITFTQEPYLRDPAKLQASIDTLKQCCEEVKVFKIPTDGNKLKWLLLLFFNLFSLLPYSVWRFWSKDMAAAIKDSLARNKFDAVEIGTIALLKYSNLAPGIPKLLVHHNIESELLKRRSKTEKNPLARAYLALQAFKLKRLEIKASKIVDHHTTVSELDKQILLKSCPDIKVTVVDNGVDTEYFTPGDETVEPNTLVYAGGMSWYPNAEAMIYFSQNIWPLLNKEIPDIKMNLIGANPPSELLEFCKTEPQFRMLGFVDDVRPFIRKSAVYIVPITVGGGTRLKILDAMAMGKAIVSTSIGCEGIKTEDGKNIVIADNPAEFARKVMLILGDEQLRAKLSLEARRTAELNYSWAFIAPKLNMVYSSIAENHRSI